jgi:hypothetical protein
MNKGRHEAIVAAHLAAGANDVLDVTADGAFYPQGALTRVTASDEILRASHAAKAWFPLTPV